MYERVNESEGPRTRSFRMTKQEFTRQEALGAFQSGASLAEVKRKFKLSDWYARTLHWQVFGGEPPALPEHMKAKRTKRS
jgi:hypothetical protein